MADPPLIGPACDQPDSIPFPFPAAAEDLEAFGDAEPRTLYAVILMAGALSGSGLSGLKALCRRREGGGVELGSVGKDAVTAAYAAADEFLRQAWGAESTGDAAGGKS